MKVPLGQTKNAKLVYKMSKAVRCLYILRYKADVEAICNATFGCTTLPLGCGNMTKMPTSSAAAAVADMSACQTKSCNSSILVTVDPHRSVGLVRIFIVVNTSTALGEVKSVTVRQILDSCTAVGTARSIAFHSKLRQGLSFVLLYY